jgi:hypothetical protein
MELAGGSGSKAMIGDDVTLFGKRATTLGNSKKRK